MSHTQEILEVLSEWQRKRFRDTDVTLIEAVKSLSTDEPLVEARPGVTLSRWIIVKKGTKKVAVLTYAGVWSWSSDLSTGNYVPLGYNAPEGLPESRIQDIPSYKCEINYAYDTTTDSSLWDHIRALEAHVVSQEGFNKGHKCRRNWQSGNNPATRQKYVVSAKVFARRTPHNTKESGEFNLPYELHPWILTAMENHPETLQIPNPDRPRYYDFSGEVLRNLEDTNTPMFNRNDVVLMTFKLGFVIGNDAWYPEIIPIEFIRVGKLPENITSTTDTAMYPSLDAEHTDLEVGVPVSVIDKPCQLGKRPADETSEETLPLNKKQHMDPEADMMVDTVDQPSEQAAQRNVKKKKANH